MPGRDWRKKGLPLFNTVKNSVTTIKIGDKTINPNNENKKSKNLLKNNLYIILTINLMYF